MKKFLALILALCMVLALTACSGGIDAGKLDEIQAALSSIQTQVDDLAAAQAAVAAEAAAPAPEALVHPGRAASPA